jgi:hypothetical protein
MHKMDYTMGSQLRPLVLAVNTDEAVSTEICLIQDIVTVFILSTYYKNSISFKTQSLVQHSSSELIKMRIK